MERFGYQFFLIRYNPEGKQEYYFEPLETNTVTIMG